MIRKPPLSDAEIVETVARLGRVTIRWARLKAYVTAVPGIRVTAARLDRLYRAGALDRESYHVRAGDYGANEIETIYFLPETKTAPVPTYAGSRAPYPLERQ